MIAVDARRLEALRKKTRGAADPCWSMAPPWLRDVAVTLHAEICARPRPYMWPACGLAHREKEKNDGASTMDLS
jgi:hypothetical protein